MIYVHYLSSLNEQSQVDISKGISDFILVWIRLTTCHESFGPLGCFGRAKRSITLDFFDLQQFPNDMSLSLSGTEWHLYLGKFSHFIFFFHSLWF